MQQDSSNRNRLLTGVVALLLIVAGGIYLLSGDRDETASGSERLSTFICPEDGNIMKMTASEHFRLLDEAAAEQQNAGGSQTGRSGGTGKLRCSKCSKFTVVPAIECADGTYVPTVYADGRIGVCKDQ